jgi:hypothetical protein
MTYYVKLPGKMGRCATEDACRPMCVLRERERVCEMEWNVKGNGMSYICNESLTEH